MELNIFSQDLGARYIIVNVADLFFLKIQTCYSMWSILQTDQNILCHDFFLNETKRQTGTCEDKWWQGGLMLMIVKGRQGQKIQPR